MVAPVAQAGVGVQRPLLSSQVRCLESLSLLGAAWAGPGWGLPAGRESPGEQRRLEKPGGREHTAAAPAPAVSNPLSLSLTLLTTAASSRGQKETCAVCLSIPL